MSDNTMLCRRLGITVKRYAELREAANREVLSAFVQCLFKERYLDPLTAIPPEQTSGFSIMALCCLTIEGLEAFRSGWLRTDDKSEEAFASFFGREESFRSLAGNEHWFWRNVRCGILHVGQTQHGWKIHNNDCEPLFSSEGRIVNARRFLAGLKHAVERYGEELKEAEWEGALWTNFRTRMEAVVEHCTI